MKLAITINAHVNDRPDYLILERFGDDLLIETSGGKTYTIELEELKTAIALILEEKENSCKL